MSLPERVQGRAPLRAALRRLDPLLLNGHLLNVSSLITAGIGALYWVVAARLFGAAPVGRSYAAISALMFLAGVGQLNLANTMVRFVPGAGAGTRRLVLRAYTAAAGTGLLLGGVFVLLTPALSPGLSFLRTPALGVGYAVATAGYALFVLQDGVLTGLRRADWVVMENTAFSTVKVAALAVLGATGATAAILGSWAIGLFVSLVLTNGYLFVRAIPRQERQQRVRVDAPTPGYLAADFTGALCWLAVTTLPPVLVLNRVGAADSAYYSIAWLITYTLYQAAINMCASLVVESAADPARLRRHVLRLLRHVGLLLGAAVLAVVLLAPWLLALFGPEYRAGGTAALRLLALSALPNLVVTCAVAVSRVRRRMRVVVGVLVALGVLVLGLMLPLLQVWGTAGGGLAWLLAQCLVAAVLLWRRDLWLPESDGAPAASPSWAESLRGLLPIRRAALLSTPGDRLRARRLARRYRPDDPPAVRRCAPGLADVLVLRLDEPPSAGPPRALVLKYPRSARAWDGLAREWEVLNRLHGDERLGEWRRLVPEPGRKELCEPLPLITEQRLPGADLAAYLRHAPDEADRAARLALAALVPFQRAATRRERADGHTAAWVDQPLAQLAAEVPWCRAATGPDPLDAVRARLRRALTDRTLAIGWTHGDFHPGNVLLDEERTRITGVIDWGGARPDGPSAVDACTFVLTLRCLLTGCELGEAVREILSRGRLDPADAELLATADPQGPVPVGPVLTGPDLVLLTWLWHVTANVAKSSRYGRSRIWYHRNIAPVLTEASQW